MENSSENRSEQTAAKNRSASACIAAGYQLFTANFRLLMRRTWPAALLYALVGALFGTYYVNAGPRLSVMAVMANNNPNAMAGQALTMFITMAVIVIVGLLALMLTSAIFASQGLAALREHQQQGAIAPTAKWLTFSTATLGRTVVVALVLLGLLVVLSLVIGVLSALAGKLLSPLTGAVLTGLLGLLMLVATLPLAYPLTRYILNPKARLQQGYGAGWRHLGLLFTVGFVCLLLVAVISALTTMPATILMTANMQAQMGVLAGDPLGMPAYVTWLTLVVFLIAGFIQAYVELSSLFPLYYACGSIDAKEQERQQFSDTRRKNH